MAQMLRGATTSRHWGRIPTSEKIADLCVAFAWNAGAAHAYLVV
jgi:hypothetical protein